MTVEAYQWTSTEKAPTAIEKPSALVYEAKELKWYDKLFRPLISIFFWDRSLSL